MNSIHNKLKLVILSIQIFLVSLASAHPGPPGHTHPDEWPFGALTLLVGLGLAVFAIRSAIKARK